MDKNIQERIYTLLQEMTAVDSVSYSAKENVMSEYVHAFFAQIPYFKEHPDQFGLYPIPNDAFGRTVPYALLLGNAPNTVVSMGHMDVVSTESYGELAEQAFQIGDELEKALAKKDLSPEARADMESGEWIWGRGAADMKGGVAMHMALFEEYAALAQKGELPGNLLMITVPDEESYSAGMREAAALILQLKNRYGLDLKMVVDPEPTNERNGAQIMSIGSVGKIMPVVMVQGVTAHVGHCFDGITPLGILAEIYQKTNISLEFSDRYKDEATVPPTWTNLRDMKELYDVSLPLRAAGYFTALTFDSTPEQIMGKIKRIAAEALENSVKELDAVYQEYKKRDKFAEKDKIQYKTTVYSFEELVAELKEKDPKGFDAYYSGIYQTIGTQVVGGELNFPGATLKMMEAVLKYADIKNPVVLIGFAPPYYLPIHSDLIKGKEDTGSNAYAIVKKTAEAGFGQKMDYENYFMGISDASYCGIDHPFDYTKFSANTPMWGDLYQLNFEAMEEIGIPAVIYGPIGKEYHQWTERVNKKSLLEVVPAVTKELFDYLWKL
ncbi:MAG: M20/M25/M40 family metallo-hydrolase [Eubacteriales bacterium]|nr:M20/M25/M40 family metallo-hydrolase [Eubacteriales bacterium]MDD3289752.1 M20/M25/M40 family metallo-hydrolase [Eubacteriales bacterium]MDD3863149.1 M20/M25/M40 family metallo-hydrolase [Eubacteriales bacterium]